MTRKPLLCCLLVWLLLCLWPSSAPAASFISRYDLTFKHWAQWYAPWEDWHWFKAQGIAESGLNQGARSAVGAVGIMQLMPATAKDLDLNPYDPEGNIQAGIKYDAQLRKLWVKAPTTEARALMFASYNAGPGNVARAVKLAGTGTWTAAAPFLVRVTGPANAKQTTDYVSRIRTFYVQLF